MVLSVTGFIIWVHSKTTNLFTLDRLLVKHPALQSVLTADKYNYRK